MNALYLLLGLSMVLVGVVIAVFIWSVRAGQFDDLSGPAYRILSDDDEGPDPPAHD